MSLDLAILRARLETAVAVDAPARPKRVSITRLAKLYRAHAAKRFNGRHGHKEINLIRQSLGPLCLLYGRQPPEVLKPLHLLAVRQLWIEQGLARTTIQARMQRIRKCWRWARRRELIECDLPDLDQIPFGHAKETLPVQPVPGALVERTLPLVSPAVRTMLQLMMLTGMRPGECCDLHSSEIDRGGDPDVGGAGGWVYRPALHKNAWRRQERAVYLGPQARALLEPGAVLRPGFVFLTKSGGRWNEKLLHSAVRKACIRAGLPKWSPNQIRHTWATMIRERMGLEHAQASLGHRRIETTQVYAEKAQRLAREVAAAFG